MLLIGTAIFFDALQAFLTFILIGFVLNPIIITPIAWLTFWLMYKTCNPSISFGDSVKRFMAFFLTGFFELIPGLDALPGWTVGAIVIISIVRVEDAAYNHKQAEQLKAEQKQIQKTLKKTESESQRIRAQQYANDNMLKQAAA